jgi:hypothetical protein
LHGSASSNLQSKITIQSIICAIRSCIIKRWKFCKSDSHSNHPIRAWQDLPHKLPKVFLNPL